MGPEKKKERRKYPRFSDHTLAGAKVDIAFYPPIYGESVSGFLIDLSAGGIGLLISDVIPKKVFLRLSLILPDDFKIETVVQVRRIIKQGAGIDFLHGFEFLNPTPEMVNHIEELARHILECHERTQQIISIDQVKAGNSWSSFCSDFREKFRKAA